VDKATKLWSSNHRSFRLACVIKVALAVLIAVSLAKGQGVVQGSVPVWTTAPGSLVAQTKVLVDIRDYYSSTSSLTACTLPCVSSDLGYAMQNIFGAFGSGVEIDLRGLTQSGPTVAYAGVDPWANVLDTFASTIFSGCGLEIRISTTWHIPALGATRWEGDCGTTARTTINGTIIEPTILGISSFPAFPTVSRDNATEPSGVGASTVANITAIAVGPPALAPTTFSGSGSGCSGLSGANQCAQFYNNTSNTFVDCGVTTTDGGVPLGVRYLWGAG